VSASTATDWEAAYLRFETPEEEARKFRQRLERLGQRAWARESCVVEICSGRGSGLRALAELGFSHLEGLDLSLELLHHAPNSARQIRGDCRRLPFPDASRDILIVQGGLHHLASLDDVVDSFREAHRVLRPSGRFVLVEPWRTSFLDFVHFCCERRWLRRCWPKLDALACMIDGERETYTRWLAQPDAIQAAAERFFNSERSEVRWGKWLFVGHPRRNDAPTKEGETP